MNWTEVEELAIAVLGLDDDADMGTIEQALYGRFEITFEAFESLVKALMPFTTTNRTRLTGEERHGFVKGGFFICSMPAAKHGEGQV